MVNRNRKKWIQKKILILALSGLILLTSTPLYTVLGDPLNSDAILSGSDTLTESETSADDQSLVESQPAEGPAPVEEEAPSEEIKSDEETLPEEEVKTDEESLTDKDIISEEESVKKNNSTSDKKSKSKKNTNVQEESEKKESEKNDSAEEVTQFAYYNQLSLSGFGNTRTFSVAASSENYASLKVAVWSKKNGQDDMHWYTMSQTTDESWSVDLSILDLKNDGTIIFHVYADETTFVGGAQFIWKSDTNTLTSLGITYGSDSNKITAVTADKNTSKLKIAVWSAEDGQDDLTWYTMTRNSSNPLSWSAKLLLKNIKHTGTIYVHVYNQENLFLGDLLFSMNEKDLQPDSITLNGNNSEKKLSFTTSKSYSKVRVAVWSVVGGQDDLHWYFMKRQSNGLWTADIPQTRFKHTGNIMYNIYSTNSTLLGSITDTYTVSGLSEEFDASSCTAEKESSWSRDFPGVETISVADSGNKKALTVITNDEQYSSMRVAVWSSEGGQDDLEWYTLEKAGLDSNIWKTDFSVKKLKHAGTVQLHLYADSVTFLAQTTITVSKLEIEKGSISLETTEDMLTINASKLKGNYHRIKAALWTEEGEQDDLIWINLKNKDGNWVAEQPLTDFENRGALYVHLYIDDEFYKGLCFTVPEEEQTRCVIVNTASSDSETSYIVADIDFLQYAIRIAQNNAIGYGHTWPETISCSGLVGLSLTNCGYANFVKNDPIGWGYIGLGSTFENTLVNEIGCSVLEGPWNKSNCLSLQPGDILYSYDTVNHNYHCGIYIGNGMTVEARGPGGKSTADTSGQEVAIYNWLSDPITFQRVYRIPENKIKESSRQVI